MTRKKEDGRKNNGTHPNTLKNLKPIYSTDDPRYKNLEKANARSKAQKLKRKANERMLKEIRTESIAKAAAAINNNEGIVLDPLEILQNFILEQQRLISDGDPQQAHKEKDLMLKAMGQYAGLLDIGKADVDNETEEDEDIESIEKELEEMRKKAQG